MAHPLSTLGIIHTLLSLPPVVAGLHGFIRHRGIDAGTRSGQIYLAGLTLSVLTSFGLSSQVGVNPGHVLGVLALLAAFGGLIVPRLRFLGALRPYLSSWGLSFSFFLLLVPGINETLTRLPAGHPLADGPQSPAVRGSLLVWCAIFLAGSVVQGLGIRRKMRELPRG